MIREQLGDDAIIVSTAKIAGEDGGVRVTAAVDQPSLQNLPQDIDEIIPIAGDTPETLRHSLMFHGVPALLAGALSRDKRAAETANPILGLAAALDERFRFRPLELKTKILLVGPPGAGKTVTAAKLAARASLKGSTTALASTDTKRAGGLDQLIIFARILGCDFTSAASVDELAKTINQSDVDLFVADTHATNPLDDDEMNHLTDLIQRIGAEPVLVIPAGGDAMEMAETGRAYADIGCTRMIATRLDTSRRLGGILSCADAGRLSFSDVGVGAQVADGLAEITPVALARLLLPEQKEYSEMRDSPPSARSSSSHPEVAE